MLILGIETSCDETSAAVVRDGRFILSNVVASQIEIHRRYGGVFPEIASRQHILSIVPVIEEALKKAQVTWEDLNGVAVTYGPGLAGSLLVGVNVAKAIAWARGLPLIGINHIEAHIYANWLTDEPPSEFPLLCLVVSGGHTSLFIMKDHGEYQELGHTLDDAAGEAFDKIARLLGLGFPGGPAIEREAKRGNPEAFKFPRAWLKGTYNFSFSGLKTAVLREIQRYGEDISLKPEVKIPAHIPVADLAASFQEAVVEVLVEKTRQAAMNYKVKEVLLAGGVAANSLLREKMKALVPVPVRWPPPELCTDNAAMVAAAGYFNLIKGLRSSWDLDVIPNLRLGTRR
ncbi:MAG: tRNA (adenosine(37)-N6)-threonylcarbamoyltransferase complex transferase subunit TsaD [Anaerolineae bacterium]|nr:tRNA (adenosine(37)-N6)-threonylcarbamoyltransferase complex transferase subunit TsaD [Anaerolineae bacterium]MDW8101891.1 tRNA (adenosine(37)-N6)-threonylcarbamoyltransferase complex transferase subunit TsaD [Anaerolineae bacterium]